MLPVISDPESLSTRADSRSDGANADSRFGILADPQRRAVLRYLDDCDGPASIADLADHLVLENHASDEGALASAGDALLGTRRRLQLSLRHSHVPKLADAGAVEFEYESNTVSLGPRSADFLARLESDGEEGTDHTRKSEALVASTQSL